MEKLVGSRESMLSESLSCCRVYRRRLGIGEKGAGVMIELDETEGCHVGHRGSDRRRLGCGLCDFCRCARLGRASDQGSAAHRFAEKTVSRRRYLGPPDKNPTSEKQLLEFWKIARRFARGAAWCQH